MMAETQPSVRVGVGVFVFRSRDDPRFVLGVRKGSLGSGIEIRKPSSIHATLFDWSQGLGLFPAGI